MIKIDYRLLCQLSTNDGCDLSDVINSYVRELSYWSKNIKDNVYTDNQEEIYSELAHAMIYIQPTFETFKLAI